MTGDLPFYIYLKLGFKSAFASKSQP